MTFNRNIIEAISTQASRNSGIYSDKNKFGFQEKCYLHDCNKSMQIDSLVIKIIEASINDKQSIHPRRFCRRWFGLEALNEARRPRFTEGQILAMESEFGYREKCINLIANILKIKCNTIHRWGKGVAFDKIPSDKGQKYEAYLGYVDAIRVIANSLTELERDTLLRLLRQLEMR